MIFTASWRTVSQTMTFGPLPFIPVRTSRGLPRFIAGAESFPFMPELAPDPWMFAVWEKDVEKFDRCYRRKLHTIGFERIRARLDELADGDHDLALCCFEHSPAECHRSQIAAVWQRWTGRPIYDLAMMVSEGHERAALVHEINNERSTDGR